MKEFPHAVGPILDSEVTMTGRLAIAAKAIGATVLAIAAGVFLWDYIAVHPCGPKLWYRVDVPNGGFGAAMVFVGGPDTQTSFKALRTLGEKRGR